MDDIINPTITTISNKTVATASGVCTYTHATNLWNPTATDNIGVTSLTYSLSGVTSGTGTTLNGRLFNKGVTTVIWTAADVAGNSKTCSFTVNVFDEESPSANCKYVTVQLDRTGHVLVFPVTIDDGSYDNCGIETFLISRDFGASYYDFLIFDCSDIGDQIVKLSVADEAGNVSTCSTTLTIEDSQDPMLDDLSTQTVQVDGTLCTYTHSGTSWDVTDNCPVTGSATGPGGGTATATITDDDLAIIYIENIEIMETNTNNPHSFVATISKVSQKDVVISFTASGGTAGASDFTQQSGVMYTIPAGATSVNIPVIILGDEIAEPTESFTGTIAISNSNGQNVRFGTGSETATATITDNDAVSVAINDVSIAENVVNGKATFTVTLTGAIQDELNVSYTTANNSAFSGCDYTTNLGSLNFPAGSPTSSIKTIDVPIRNDVVAEPTESFCGTISISNTNNQQVFVETITGTATAAISNDDAKVMSLPPALVDLPPLPVIMDLSKTTLQNLSFMFIPEDFTSKFIETVNDQLIKIRIESLPQHGRLSLNEVNVAIGQEYQTFELNRLKFIPELDYTGSTYFRWSGSDRKEYAGSSAKVDINIEPQSLFIPAGFSPNGDGINDFFVIKGAEHFDVTLKVFNRWGNIVFEGKQYKNDWGGVSNVGILIGNQLPGGTYYYTVNLGNGTKGIAGYITLNR